VRHFVPIDGQTSTGEVCGTSQAHAAPFWKFAELVLPIRDFDDALNAFGEIHRAELQEIGRHCVWSFDNS
jgi:hypothetical protein